MHTESGRRIYFQYGATDLVDRRAKVFCHYIDPANIQSDDPGNPLKHENIGWVYLICYIGRCATGGKISSWFEQNKFTFFGNGIECIAFIIQHFLRELVDGDLRKHFFMSITTAGIFVGFIDQVTDSVYPVTSHRSRCSKCCANEFIIDHQRPEVKTGDEFFNNNVSSVFLCRFKSF